MKPVPAPAIIDGVEWQVRDSGDPQKAYVDFATQTMVVPMDCGEVGDLVRNHEMAHVAITPRLKKRELEALAKEFPNRTLQAVEDARVYAALQRAGINTDVARFPSSDYKAVASMDDSPKNREEKARCLIATKGTKDHEGFAEKMPSDLVAKVNEFYNEHFQPFIDKGEIPPFDKTKEMAKAVHEYCWEEVPPEEREGEGDENEVDGKDRGKGKGSESSDSQDEGDSDPEDGEGEGEDNEGNSSSSNKEGVDKGEKELTRPFTPGDTRNTTPQPVLSKNDVTEEEKKDIEEILGKHMREYMNHGGYGGVPLEDDAVKFSRPKLTLTQKGHATGNKKICTDTGSVPRRLSRYATDGAVFSRVTKKGFASVLIDCSGSMNLSNSDVAHIVDSLPHCNVACYSGSGHHGEITLVAKDGKRAAELPRQHGGNVVDMQAVEWLARQRGPRYWICDGIVTGKSDSLLGPLAILKIVRICKLARIKRFNSIDALLKGLAEKKGTAY